MAGYNPYLLQAIRKYSQQYGIDPTLLVATTLVESGGRLDAVGDGGHSFGPYQMNDQGRLASMGYTKQQAMDPDLATRAAAQEFASVAKRYGVSGAQLASDAQRPADRAGYQRKINAVMGQARAILAGQGGAVSDANLNAPVTGTDTGSAAAPGPVSGKVTLDAESNARLMQWVAESEREAKAGRVVDIPTDVLESIRQAKIQQQAQGGGVSGSVAGDGHDHNAVDTGYAGELVGSAIDRPGAATSQDILNYARQVSAYYGQPITLGTGTQHNRMTTSGNVSAHWSGRALDLPSSGDNLIRMGRAALRAAGYQGWQNTPGGLYNVGGKQIIFGVNNGAASGGNHLDHLHIGLR